VAGHADQPTWDRLRAMAKSAKTELERQEFYVLLGSAEDEALSQQALTLSLSGEPPKTIAPSVILAVSNLHPQMAFDFAAAHWDALSALLEPSTQSGYMPRLLGNASDLALVDKLQAFAESRIPPDARQDVLKAEATVRYLAKVRTERLPEAAEWLRRHGS
jgi:hypothetical protein